MSPADRTFATTPGRTSPAKPRQPAPAEYVRPAQAARASQAARAALKAPGPAAGAKARLRAAPISSDAVLGYTAYVPSLT